MNEKKKVIHPRITEEQFQWIREQITAAGDCSVSAVIRKLIQKQINKEDRE